MLIGAVSPQRLADPGATFSQGNVAIDIMGLPVCRKGLTVDFDEDEALRRFEEPEVVIDVDLGVGNCVNNHVDMRFLARIRHYQWRLPLMKYAKDTRPEGASTEAAKILVEALPWIKNITGKTVVIKYGGCWPWSMRSCAPDVMSDIVLLKIVGVNPVIVHGGGKAITRAMDLMEIPVEFKDGQRVTTPEAMNLVRTVLMGEVNQELVEALNHARQSCRGRLRC